MSRNLVKSLALAALLVVFQTSCAQVEEQPAMGFFITSVNMGEGANLGGLAGADGHCQVLADAIGSGGRTWRAYLSTATVDARDRIGSGPWYNVIGELIATDVDDLHEGNDNIYRENSYTETGGRIPGIDDPGTAHDMLTGSGADGRMVLEQEGVGGIAEHTTGKPATCNDWTGGDGRARVGHFDSHRGEPGTVWNSAHYTQGCSQEDLEKNANIGLFYCFAAD
jgi:hypothetical protein